MSILDKVKGLLKGRESQVKSGIDKASDTIEKKVGRQHADKVEGAAEKAKDGIDKFSPSAPERPSSATRPTATPPATAPTSPTPPPATPPVP